MKEIKKPGLKAAVFFFIGAFILIVVYFDPFQMGIPNYLKQLSKIFVLFCVFATSFLIVLLQVIKWEKKQEMENHRDPIWHLKREIRQLIAEAGEMDLHHLAIRLKWSCKDVKKALEDMEREGLVEKREPLSKEPSLQTWGIVSLFRKKANKVNE